MGLGENSGALRECLSYLDEWLPGRGYVIVFTNAGRVLHDEPDHQRVRKWLVNLLRDVGEWWSEPVEGQGHFNRPAKPFKVVFEFENEADMTGWNAILEQLLAEGIAGTIDGVDYS